MKPLLRPSRLFSAPILTAVIMLSAAVCVAQDRDEPLPLSDSSAFLEKVHSQEKAGLLTPSEAMLYRFQFLFDPVLLPPDFQVAAFSPVRCGTDLVGQFYRIEDRLDPEVRQTIRRYLEIENSRLTFLSTEGRFQLTYSLTGLDAVPAADVHPANGVPDFVERAAQYLEQAWTVEIMMMGFHDPLTAGQPLPVSFRSMQNYGYVYVVDEEAGLTGMVLHNNYLGFPPNADPDGDVLGALKVTAAHEFKHCSQYLATRWGEGGWIELDAVWAEDLVFDQANDYYNYLPGGSPIRHPELPLDGGSTGTGSYEDCVWQHWMSESFGVGIVRAFWERRAAQAQESVLTTYGHILGDHGLNWTEAWARFTAWNYATSNRAVVGVGYQEAAFYPLGPVRADFSDYPAVTSGDVEHLAAHFIRLLDLDSGWDGSLELGFSFGAGEVPLTLAVMIQKTDGSAVLEVVDTSSGGEVSHTLGIALHDIAAAGVIVGNPAVGGAPRSYQLEAVTHEVPPEPLLQLVTPDVAIQVVTGQTATTYALLGNGGEEGSVLGFQAAAWGQDPALLLPEISGAGDKSVAGSLLTCTLTEYTAGNSLDLPLTLFNGSTDDEWLTRLSLTLPAGVTLVSATPFVGGSLGDLEWSGVAGDAVTTRWEGSYGAQGYGVIRDGESATATVELTVAQGFSGPLELTGVVTGDSYGAAPHQVPVAVVLAQRIPQVSILEPAGYLQVALGTPLQVVWQQDGTLESLDIQLSRDGGDTWEWLGQVDADQEAFTWIAAAPASLDCRIRLEAMDGAVRVQTPERFALYPRADWLDCTGNQGVITEGNLAAVILHCNATALLPGTRQAWLVIEHDGPGLPGVIPVTAEIQDGVAGAGRLPGAPGFEGNYPNPFNPMTRLRFQLDATRQVTLEILDLRGRIVRRLVNGEYPAGSHSITWDGRDDRGRALPSGLYLARMRAGSFTATGKMLLSK